MKPLDPSVSAWVPLKEGDVIYIQSMIVLQEKNFEGELLVFGWINNGLGMYPREHVYQTKKEAAEAGYNGKSLVVPEEAVGTPWRYSLAPQKQLEHFFILPNENEIAEKNE